MAWNTRIPALMVKELLALLRDPRGRLVLIVLLLLQLAVFAFAATLEVRNVSVAVFDQDHGRHGHELVQRLAAAKTFTRIELLESAERIPAIVDRQQALAVLRIPPHFSRDVEAGRPASVQLVLDGRRSNAAQIVNGYVAEIVRRYGEEIAHDRRGNLSPVEIVERNWFNANLRYLWFTAPSLVGILSMLVSLIVTALSVARERELGTFDQLLVSPLTPFEILVGKTVPAIAIGAAMGSAIGAAGVFVFGVPFTGSAGLLLLALLVFIASVVGVGLFVSSLARTQQQAILGAFVFMVPAVTLSGYAAPVENMPAWLQAATWANPLKHFLITVKGVYLKDMPAAEVWANTWPLAVIALFTLSVAGWMFTRRLE